MRRPGTQPLWQPQPPEELGQVKEQRQRRQEGFLQERALAERLMPWVRGGSRHRTEAHAGGGCRTRLDTCIGTEAREVWVSQWAPVQGTTSAMPLTPSPVSPLLKSIPGPFLLVYLQKRSRSSLTGAKGSKYLRNATVETAGDPAKPRGSRSPESRGRAVPRGWRRPEPVQVRNEHQTAETRQEWCQLPGELKSGHHEASGSRVGS